MRMRRSECNCGGSNDGPIMVVATKVEEEKEKEKDEKEEKGQSY